MSTDTINLLRHYLSALSQATKRRSEIPRPAITISRESGAGALNVADLLARRLNLGFPGDPPRPWIVFDRTLISKILQDRSLSNRIEAFMPEDAPFPLSKAFEYLLGLHPAGWTFRDEAKDTIRKLAMNGNVILIGRAGAIIAARMPYVLHVRLVAPFGLRVRNYAQSQGMSARQAVQVVRANDRASQHYVRSYFNTNVRDQSHYDLIINTETNGFEGAACVISAALRSLLARDPGGKSALHSVEGLEPSETVSEGGGIDRSR